MHLPAVHALKALALPVHHRHTRFCTVPTRLAVQVAPVIERMPSKEGEQAVPATAVEAGGLPELRQPLLAEEAPTPVTQRAGLARALAIVRCGTLQAGTSFSCLHRADSQC